MQQEVDSLEEHKAFEHTSLPTGWKAIGIYWTYDYKHKPDELIICRKKKVHLAA